MKSWYIFLCTQNGSLIFSVFSKYYDNAGKCRAKVAPGRMTFHYSYTSFKDRLFAWPQGTSP